MRRYARSATRACWHHRDSTHDQSVHDRTAHSPEDEGDLEYEVTIEPVAGESTLENNVARATVSVRSTQIRVLLVERTPRWEFRHLKPLLERDKMIELKTVLQESDIDFVQEDRTALPNFPARQVDLNEFDVVILGDIDLSLLNSQSLGHLKTFVSEQGGGLILVAGERHNPLSYAGRRSKLSAPLLLSELQLPAPELSEAVSSWSQRRRPSPGVLRLDDQTSIRRSSGGHCPRSTGHWSRESVSQELLRWLYSRADSGKTARFRSWSGSGSVPGRCCFTPLMSCGSGDRGEKIRSTDVTGARRSVSSAGRKLLGDDRSLHLSSDVRSIRWARP